MINPESLLILCQEVLLFFYISLDSELGTLGAGGRGWENNCGKGLCLHHVHCTLVH
jgi:hypothetical protein